MKREKVTQREAWYDAKIQNNDNNNNNNNNK